MAKTKAALRREAAEEVCWTIMLMISLESDDDVNSQVWRQWLGKPLHHWADLAVATGQMKE